MGIAKIQSADNVLAFIPNAQARDSGVIRAKLLKTRDSSGVGNYVNFKTEWSTLSFIPWTTETNGVANFQENTYSNVSSPKNSDYSKAPASPSLKRQTGNVPKLITTIKSDDTTDTTSAGVISNDDADTSASSIIRRIKGRSKPNSKHLKIL